jgi:hypothetical protein
VLRTPTKASGIGSKLSPRPSSPPVSPSGFFCTSTCPACANASVTIANAIPPTRRLIPPSRSGTTIPTKATASSEGTKPHSHFVNAIVIT